MLGAQTYQGTGINGPGEPGAAWLTGQGREFTLCFSWPCPVFCFVQGSSRTRQCQAELFPAASLPLLSPRPPAWSAGAGWPSSQGETAACPQPLQNLGNSSYRSFSTAASSCSMGLGFAPRRREYVRSTTCSHLKQPEEEGSEKIPGERRSWWSKSRLVGEDLGLKLHRTACSITSRLICCPFFSHHLYFSQPTSR